MSVLAIDQGTTSTRAMKVDDAGNCKLVAVNTHRQLYPQSGWVEHDPTELITHIQNGLSAAGQVEAVGMDNQGESCLAWHAITGEPVTNVIVWQDTRTQAAIERLKSDGAESLVLQRAGLPLDPYFSASKLAWICNEVPQARSLLRQENCVSARQMPFFLIV